MLILYRPNQRYFAHVYEVVEPRTLSISKSMDTDHI